MMNKLFLILSLLIYMCMSATIVWTGGAGNGLFSDSNNWSGGVVPGGADVARIQSPNQIVIVTGSGATVTGLEIAANSVTFRLSEPNGNLNFNINGNMTVGGSGNKIQTAASCTLAVSQYAFLSGSISFNNLGAISFAPYFQGASLSNQQPSNNIILKGGFDTVVSSSTSVPSGFAYENTAIRFKTLTGSRTLTFNYLETVSASGWVFDNNQGIVNIVFNDGVNLNGQLTVVNTTISKPTVTFSGPVTTGNPVTLDVNPVLSGQVYFNGGKITFQDKSPSFSSSLVGGTGQVEFGQTALRTVSVNTDVDLVNPNFQFTGQWIFNGGGRNFNFNYSATINQNYTNNCNFYFPSGLTIQGGFVSPSGSGSYNIFSTLSGNTGYTWPHSVNFRCYSPARTFALSGSSQTFEGGIDVYACSVSSSSTFTVRGSLYTFEGNSTLPASTVMSISNNPITFGSNTISNSITMTGNWNTNSNNDWIISSVELIIGGTFQVASQCDISGSGMLTLNGDPSFSNNFISVSNLNFINRVYTINTQVKITSRIHLRNAELAGAGIVDFRGTSIYATKGVSRINNANFQFGGSSITGIYLSDDVHPKTAAWVYIQGSSSSRLMDDIYANSDFNFVFVDPVSFNRSSITVSASTSNGGIHFMNRTTTTIGYSTVAFSGDIFFNATTNELKGAGNYIFSSSANIYLLGHLNPSTSTQLAPVTTTGTIDLYLGADVTIGPSVIFGSGLNTYDDDGNNDVASRTLTLESDREIDGYYIFGCNIIIGGKVKFTTSQTTYPPGYMRITTNQVEMNSVTYTMYNELRLAASTTITGTGSSSLRLYQSTNIPYQLTLPSLVINSASLFLGTSTSNTLNIQASTSYTGTGTLYIYDGSVFTTSASTTINMANVNLRNTQFTGAGPLSITSNQSPITFASTVDAVTPTTVTNSYVTLSSTTTITGFVFSANPVTFQGSTLNFADVRSIGTNYHALTNLVFLDDATIATNGQFSGTGTITFRTSLTLSSNYQFSSNPVVLGQSNTQVFIIAGSNLTFSNPSVTVLGNVASGGSYIFSTSPSNYVHQLNGGSPGIIPSEWTWTNQIQIGRINVTGARTLTNILMLTNNVQTIFTGGLTLSGAGGITYDNPSSTNCQLRVEGSFTTNNQATIPHQIDVFISGESFTFGGSNVLSINGTFNCETRITFANSVTFGYLLGASIYDINMYPLCNFLGTSQLNIYRNNVYLRNSGSSSQTLVIENPLFFGLLPSNQPAFRTSGTNNFAEIRGSITVNGDYLSFTSTRWTLGAINITTLRNATLSGLTPTSTLGFISTSSPWVEPLVSFSGGTLNNIIEVYGPIRVNSLTIGSQANFVGTGRVAFTNSISLSGSNNYYSFSAPTQMYVTTPSTDFTINLGSNYLIINQLPSLFNQFGFSAPNFVISGNSGSFVRTLYTGTLTMGDLTISGSTIVRLSSGSLTAQTLTVNTGNTLWVDGATLTTTNLIFSETTSARSTFEFTISQANPTAVTSSYTFFTGSAVVNVVNFAWTGSAVTAISSTTSNTNGQFSSLSGSPGYTYTQTRSGASIQFAGSLNPTATASPTQSNGPSTATPLSSSSIIVINTFVLLLILFFTLF